MLEYVVRFLLHFIIVIGIVQIGAAAPALEMYGAEANPTGSPIGGGIGYNDIIKPDDPRVIAVVRNKAGLINALGRASPGDIVYVDGSANIDMTGTFDVRIPTGVTIASNRGENGAPGGRIYQNRMPGDPLVNNRIFITNGPNIRLTGLRIQGPDPHGRNPPDIRVAVWSYHTNFVVDNCEIYEFGYAGIRIQNTGSNSGQYIHHNHIHTNLHTGTGYGVAIVDSEVLIEANLFDYNRHSIATAGRPNCAYEARYNIIGPNTMSTDFDMHQDPDDPNWGGNWVWIHHNTFTNPNVFAFGQRGYPRTGAWVEYNVMNSAALPAPIRQRYYYDYAKPVTNERLGRVYVSNNIIQGNLVQYGPVSYREDPNYVEPTPYPLNPRAPTPTPTPTPTLYEVTGVTAIGDFAVEYGTSFQEIGLPRTVQAIIQDGSVQTVNVEWSGAVSDYDGTTSGTYRLEGILVNLRNDIINPDGVVAQININVGKKPVSPTNPSRQEMRIPIHVGYNLISVPYEDAELTPTSPSSIRIFSPTNNPNSREGTVIELDEILPGRAYWVSSTSVSEIIVKGTESSSTTIELEQGWNPIGPLSHKIDMNNITIDPSDAWSLPFVYAYNPERRSYEAVTTLQPGRGYFGAMSSGCTIILP